ncbi:MAG TPA: hypothetical protein VK174_12520 [Chitinophagales bacterium]|nr:hypothetical protein [Chitinophagales bacterium]
MVSGKQYEVLASLPVYGPMYVPVSYDGNPFYSEGFAVRFHKLDGSDWVANFETGCTELKQVIELENTHNLLVIAGGMCYIVNPNETQPVSVFGSSYKNVFKANNNRFVLTDTTDLTIVEADGIHWQSERISFDGLKDVKVDNNLVTGVAYYPVYDSNEWVPFFYDIDTKTLIGGSFNKKSDKKSWWKLW